MPELFAEIKDKIRSLLIYNWWYLLVSRLAGIHFTHILLFMFKIANEIRTAKNPRFWSGWMLSDTKKNREQCSYKKYNGCLVSMRDYTSYFLGSIQKEPVFGKNVQYYLPEKCEDFNQHQWVLGCVATLNVG